MNPWKVLKLRTAELSKAGSLPTGGMWRVATGSLPAASSTNVTVTFPTAFTDTNYTLVAAVEDSSSADGLRVLKIVSRTTTGVVVRVQNADTLNARSGTLHILAFKD